jgi:hypothetical protein
MISSKSREHRIRVLENQTKLAGDPGVTSRTERAEPQMRMPLIVEVKSGATTKQRPRRTRGRSGKGQPELGEL